MMIYSKTLFAAFLLAFATTCEAEYTRQSRTVRGSTDEETSRLLNPTRGKGGDSGKGGKSKKVYSFTNPKKGKEVCALKETTFVIDGPSTAIPSANAPLPAGYSFKDCNDLLSVTCRSQATVLAQVGCLFPTPQTVVPDFTSDLTDFYKCLEKKGVINGPWFFHRDTPGSEFRFTTANGGTDDSPGSVCSKITYDRIAGVLLPKAEIEYFSEEFFETKLSDFVSFSVDYKVVRQRDLPPATNQYFINMYVRIDPSSTFFYDCNFNFIPDDAMAPKIPPMDWETFRFDLDTMIDSGRDRSNGNPPISTDPTKDCASYKGKTLQDFLDDHPDTVIGVGNGNPETINLVVGETSSNYKGLEVCWDNAQVTTKTDRFVYDFEPSA